MPADYTAAILYHTTEPDAIDPALLAAVQEEEYLAIHSCEPRIEQGKNSIWIPGPGKWLTVYEPGKLYWDIDATVLRFDGLANVHPGTLLSRRLLVSANATWRMPFQRLEASDLAYENPRLVHNAAELPRLNFTLAESMDGGLDTVNYPGSSSASYFDIPAQSGVTPPTAVQTQLLQDVFQNAGNFDGDLMVQPYDGDPTAGGIAVLDATSCDPWTAVSGMESQTQSAAAEIPEDTTSWSVSHFRWYRLTASRLTLDVALATSVTVPANHVLRLDAADFLMNLEWPYAGAVNAAPFALTAAAYLMGDTSTGIETAGSNFTIKAWDADPDDGGSLVDSWTLARSALQWSVSGTTAQNINTLTGATNAPGGGWSHPAGFLTAELPGVAGYAVKVEFEINVSAGTKISVPAGTLIVTLP